MVFMDHVHNLIIVLFDFFQVLIKPFFLAHTHFKTLNVIIHFERQRKRSLTIIKLLNSILLSMEHMFLFLIDVDLTQLFIVLLHNRIQLTFAKNIFHNYLNVFFDLRVFELFDLMDQFVAVKKFLRTVEILDLAIHKVSKTPFTGVTAIT